MLHSSGGRRIRVSHFPDRPGQCHRQSLMPVMKMREPAYVRLMSEHIDVDVSGILRREMTIDQAGES